MKEKFLPIGTVVLLKEATKRMMITGYCSATPDAPDKTYDYVGVLFPEGNLGSEEVALFNHDMIGTIAHMGLDDEEYKAFDAKIKKILAEEEQEKQAAQNPGVELFGSGRLEDLLPLTPENIQKILTNIKENGLPEVIKEPTAFSEESLQKPNFSATSLTKEDKDNEEDEEGISNSFSLENYEQEEKIESDGTPVLQLQLIGSESENSHSTLAPEQPSVASLGGESVNIIPLEMPKLAGDDNGAASADGGNTTAVIPGLERL